MNPDELRLRKVVMETGAFHDLLLRVGSLPALGWYIGNRASLPMVKLHAIRHNGDQVEVFLHHETFAPEKCMCRAPIWKVEG